MCREERLCACVEEEGNGLATVIKQCSSEQHATARGLPRVFVWPGGRPRVFCVERGPGVRERCCQSARLTTSPARRSVRVCLYVVAFPPSCSFVSRVHYTSSQNGISIGISQLFLES